MSERINAYTCDTCDGRIVTVDREPGVTPMFLRCRVTDRCPGFMCSSMYHVPTFVEAPTFEWRKPTPEERAACTPETLEHIDKGGLMIYPIRALKQEVKP